MNAKSPSALTMAAFLMFSIAIPVFAHHSFSAEFDANKPVTLSGKVTKVDWTNPHIWFYIDTKDATGKVANWGFEMGSPNNVLKLGWTRNSLKAGDAVTIRGYLAKDGSNRANAVDVVLPDGKKVLAGTSGDSTSK